MSQFKLLSVGSDSKTVKGEKFGFLTGILYLSPASLSGVNLCPGASDGCRAACLYTSGLGGIYKTVNEGRMKKTLWFLRDRAAFMKRLFADIHALVRKAARENLTPVLRLNGTSDIEWENVLIDGKNVFEHFPTLQCMDYTKIAKRFFKGAKARSIPNYHLTFSRSENNGKVAQIVAEIGGNVAVVFSGKNHPDTYMGRKVISGDESDLRFLDAPQSIVALYAKGQAKKDTSGFVVQVS